MNKTSTLHLTIHSLASKSNEELQNLSPFYSLEKEFDDVFEVLNSMDFDVRQEVVDHILEMTCTSS